MSDLFLKGSATFNGDKTIRWSIQRWWVNEPRRRVVWLMLNPSKAGENISDPTADRVTHFSKSWGYDGWIGVNLYPFVTSKPEVMWQWADWKNNDDYGARDHLQSNLQVIENHARMSAGRVVAFGAQPIQRDDGWLQQCLEAFGQPSLIKAVDERFYCLGVNKNGQPLHPMARGRMRVPDSAPPILWRNN